MNKYSLETLAQIDWDMIVDLLTTFSHFDTTPATILHNNQNLAHQEIQDIFDNTEQWINSLQSDDNTFFILFSNIRPDRDLTKLAHAISKNSTPSLEELNLIACCCENYFACFNSFPDYYSSNVNFSLTQKSVIPFIKKIRLLIDKKVDIS